MKKMYRVYAASAAALLACAAVPAAGASAAESGLPINRNKTDKVFSDQQNTAYASCNDVYYDAWNGAVGSWLAYDISDTPAADRKYLNLGWYSGAWNNYDYTVLNESPGASLSAYTVSVNTAAGGGACPEDGWKDLCTVKDYTCHSGEVYLDLSGMDPVNWVRITADGVQNGASQVNLNVDIHSVKEGDLPDSFLFLGDSITAGGMVTFSAGDGNFADLVYAIAPSHYPAQENGGIGGIFSTEGKNNIDRWLASYPGKYVSIAYGTNDCWGDQTGAEKYYENTVYMIRAIQNAGKIAILPKIPFSLEKGVSANIERYNAQVDRIYEEFPDVLRGPDFYAYFEEHPEGLSADGVHPNSDGYNEMRKLWAKQVCEEIYTAKQITPLLLSGDVNGDGKVSVADAVALANYLCTKTDTLAGNAANADLNGDGRLNAVDLSLLKQQILASRAVIQPPVMRE